MKNVRKIGMELTVEESRTIDGGVMMLPEVTCTAKWTWGALFRATINSVLDSYNNSISLF